MRRFLFVVLLYLVSPKAQAQLGFNRVDTIPVKIGAKTLRFPWAGGLNFVQSSAIDLNYDGKKDLAVFDRTGNKFTTFINKGTASSVDYDLDLSYLSKIPAATDIGMFIDFNFDGKEDLFTYTPGGLMVYKNTGNATIGLKFELYKDLIRTSVGTMLVNLYVSPVDIPAFTDTDNDGDLDVLTFSLMGSYVEHHLNKSKELFGHADSLKFELVNNCWGNFYENTTDNNVTLGISCKGTGGGIAPPGGSAGAFQPKKIAHAGSTLLSIDLDGDGDKDLLLGDVSHANVVKLTNGGDASTANIVAQEDSFPSYDKKISQTLFPGMYYVDVNNDNVKDLLVSPNASNLCENFTSNWYFRNTGTNTAPVFSFQKKDFLQDDMIDLGEGAYPLIFDIDNDGLKDLLVANSGYFHSSGTLKTQVAALRNIGSLAFPKFELISRDYSNLGSYGIQGLYPALGDLDGDGDKDMMAGAADGKLYYFTNMAPFGGWASFSLTTANFGGIDVGAFSTPQLIDVDEDGKLDLLIGERNGNVNYYRNTGSTTSPAFTLENANFGEVSTAPFASITGYSTPRMIKYKGSFLLFSGSDQGGIYRYSNIDGNLDGTFTKNDSTFLKIWTGIRTGLDIGDLTNDGKPEMVLGNYGGGLAFFMNDSTKVSGFGILGAEQENNINLYPNPASDELHIVNPFQGFSEWEISLYDETGRRLGQYSANKPHTTIDTSELPQGLYFVRVRTKEETVHKKIVITR